MTQNAKKRTTGRAFVGAAAATAMGGAFLLAATPSQAEMENTSSAVQGDVSVAALHNGYRIINKSDYRFDRVSLEQGHLIGGYGPEGEPPMVIEAAQNGVASVYDFEVVVWPGWADDTKAVYQTASGAKVTIHANITYDPFKSASQRFQDNSQCGISDGAPVVTDHETGGRGARTTFVIENVSL